MRKMAKIIAVLMLGGVFVVLFILLAIRSQAEMEDAASMPKRSVVEKDQEKPLTLYVVLRDMVHLSTEKSAVAREQLAEKILSGIDKLERDSAKLSLEKQEPAQGLKVSPFDLPPPLPWGGDSDAD